MIVPKNSNTVRTKTKTRTRTRTTVAGEHVRSNGRHTRRRRLPFRVVGMSRTSHTVSGIVVPRVEEMVTVSDSVSETVVSRLFWVSAVGSKKRKVMGIKRV